MTTTITISVPDSLKTFVESQIATKGFGNVSEYFRSLLRTAQAEEQEARLEALLLESLASNRVSLDETLWKRLESKTEAIITRRSAGNRR